MSLGLVFGFLFFSAFSQKSPPVSTALASLVHAYGDDYDYDDYDYYDYDDKFTEPRVALCHEPP